MIPAGYRFSLPKVEGKFVYYTPAAAEKFVILSQGGFLDEFLRKYLDDAHRSPFYH